MGALKMTGDASIKIDGFALSNDNVAGDVVDLDEIVKEENVKASKITDKDIPVSLKKKLY